MNREPTLDYKDNFKKFFDPEVSQLLPSVGVSEDEFHLFLSFWQSQTPRTEARIVPNGRTMTTPDLLPELYFGAISFSKNEEMGKRLVECSIPLSVERMKQIPKLLWKLAKTREVIQTLLKLTLEYTCKRLGVHFYKTRGVACLVTDENFEILETDSPLLLVCPTTSCLFFEDTRHESKKFEVFEVKATLANKSQVSFKAINWSAWENGFPCRKTRAKKRADDFGPKSSKRRRRLESLNDEVIPLPEPRFSEFADQRSETDSPSTLSPEPDTAPLEQWHVTMHSVQAPAPAPAPAPDFEFLTSEFCPEQELFTMVSSDFSEDSQ